MVAVARFAGATLTGINDLRGKHKKARVVVCGSGTTLKDLDLAEIPDDWVVVAVNEAIRKVGERADYWVLSDEPIVRGYAKLCPKDVTILAMHQATVSIPKVLPDHTFYTVNSINVISTPDDGFNFFSRGTVLIGAIEMLRFAGAVRFYCFGLDCFRTEDGYYYDGRKPPMVTEQRCAPLELGKNVPSGVRIYVTSRLKNMVKKLYELTRAGLWDEVEVHCVNSPYSQQESVPKMTMEEFRVVVAKETKRKKENKKQVERRKRAEQEAGGKAASESTESQTAEGSGEHGSEGGTADSDGPGDAAVVDRDSGDDSGQDRPESGDADAGGDRDPHGGNVSDGDEGAPAPREAGELPDD